MSCLHGEDAHSARALTRVSGGHSFPIDRITDVERALDTVRSDLRERYFLGYRPEGAGDALERSSSPPTGARLIERGADLGRGRAGEGRRWSRGGARWRPVSARRWTVSRDGPPPGTTTS